MRSTIYRLYILIAAALMALTLSCCVRFSPTVAPDETLPPPATPTPEPTAEPTPSISLTPAISPTATLSAYDELGAFITGNDHYQRYLTFSNIQVYEQKQDTFVDMVAVNAYPHALVCAVSMRFFDENGETVAKCRFQTQDGQYVLILREGETTLYAQVPTDMTLTSMDFELIFDDALGVTTDRTQ